MNSDTAKELSTFINGWNDASDTNKTTFIRFKDRLAAMEGVSLDFISRPGITYSLRAVHKQQSDKELFVMVDVIEDDSRWLSVCFYGDMITDPEEKGDFVPGGLLGDDAVCFDLEEQDDALVSYIEQRLVEAAEKAAGQ